MTVMAYKMISGEEVIAKVEATNSEWTELRNPATIMMQDDGRGKIGMGLIPFAVYAKDNKVIMYNNAIAFKMEIDVKLENEYNRIFGSGIQIATTTDLPR